MRTWYVYEKVGSALNFLGAVEAVSRPAAFAVAQADFPGVDKDDLVVLDHSL